MINRRSLLGSIAGLVATRAYGAGKSPDMSRLYDGPEVTHIEVRKSNRKMYLWSNGKVIRSYEVDLGFAPEGPKQFEGDGKTPEGTYWINRRNPESRFFLSLGISYPNRADRAFAKDMGKKPGGDIFIHGQTGARVKGVLNPDWTAGCIALTNRNMREVYWMVRLWTPITIRA